MTPQSLTAEIAALGMQANVTILPSGNWHVQIHDYSLTITNPDQPISATNIVAGARHFEGRKHGERT